MKLKIFILISSIILSKPKASAFKPIGHMVLADKVCKELPQESMFKKCMEMYPDYARLGSIAPDLPAARTYMTGMSYFHYHTPNVVAKELLEKAVALTRSPHNMTRGDSAFVSFAAGWITHITGDFGSHGTYVYPFAGFYISGNGAEKGCHSKLELMADEMLFYKYATPSLIGKARSQKKKKHEFILNQMLLEILKTDSLLASIDKRLNHILRQDSSLNNYRRNRMALTKNLASMLTQDHLANDRLEEFWRDRFTPADPPASVPNIKDSLHYESLIEKAFQVGHQRATELIIEAENNNNYASFNDNWNLDVGENATVTYTIDLDTRWGKWYFLGLGGGTRNNFYIKLFRKNKVVDSLFLTEENVLEIAHMPNAKIKRTGMGIQYYAYAGGVSGLGLTTDPQFNYTNSRPDPSKYDWDPKQIDSIEFGIVKARTFSDKAVSLKWVKVRANGELIADYGKTRLSFSKKKRSSVKLNSKTNVATPHYDR